jgi:hypothetical protein
MKMEQKGFSKILVFIYETTVHHTQEDFIPTVLAVRTSGFTVVTLIFTAIKPSSSQHELQ